MLLALSHIILNLTLCGALAKLPAGTAIPMHVQMSYRVGGAELDKVIPIQRETVGTGVVEFDIARSTYRLDLYVPKYDCGTSDFVDVLADRPRTIAETLVPGKPGTPPPQILFGGMAPMSFLYAKPTFVLFDRKVACDAPVGAPLPSHTVNEYDNASFYTSLFLDAGTDTVTPSTLAVRFRTPTGLYHYIKFPLPFPQPFGGWPVTVHYNVGEDDLLEIATRKPDTLICTKFFETSAG